jgi:hypothetical protein
VKPRRDALHRATKVSLPYVTELPSLGAKMMNDDGPANAVATGARTDQPALIRSGKRPPRTCFVLWSTASLLVQLCGLLCETINHCRLLYGKGVTSSQAAFTLYQQSSLRTRRCPRPSSCRSLSKPRQAKLRARQRSDQVRSIFEYSSVKVSRLRLRP